MGKISFKEFITRSAEKYYTTFNWSIEQEFKGNIGGFLFDDTQAFHTVLFLMTVVDGEIFAADLENNKNIGKIAESIFEVYDSLADTDFLDKFYETISQSIRKNSKDLSKFFKDDDFNVKGFSEELVRLYRKYEDGYRFPENKIDLDQSWE